jgi:two-component system, OmpR family, phosphate regulon response regulator PhoB
MNILIVDDSRFLRLSNERALVKAGHQVITAADGEEGLLLARERKPDLVVLDMMLPKLSGPDVLLALRKEPATCAIPVMVLTSLPQANEERLVGAGATAYFQKSLLALDKGSGPFVDAVEKLLAQAVKVHAAAG